MNDPRQAVIFLRSIPRPLSESGKIRLRRLVPGAVAKPDGEVAIPVSGTGAAVCATLVDLLGELVPADEAAPLASAAP